MKPVILFVITLFFYSLQAQTIQETLKKGPSLSFPIGVTRDDMEAELKDFQMRPTLPPTIAQKFQGKNAKLMGSFYLNADMGAFIVIVEIKKGFQEFYLLTYTIKTNQNIDNKLIGYINRPGDGNNIYQTFEIDKHWIITIEIEKSKKSEDEPKMSAMKIQKDGKIKKVAIEE